MATQHTSTRTQMVPMRDGAMIYTKIIGNHVGKKLFIAHHGGPGALNYEATEKEFGFLKTRYRVLLFDARGSGFSDKKGPFTREQWAADLEDLRRWAGADKFVLGGGSHGGVVALEYAVHYDHLSALILFNTTADGRKTRQEALSAVLTQNRVYVDKDRQTRLWTGNIASNEDFAIAISEATPLFVYNAEAAKAAAASLPIPSTAVNYVTQNAAIGEDINSFNVLGSLDSIKVPTLIVAGRHDILGSVARAEELHQGISGSKMVVIENAGHNTPLEEPEKWQSVLKEFVDAL